MGFSQHQSFYIRYKWITKALKSIELDEGKFFNDNNNYLKLGIGKNMFTSMKYWVFATKLAEKSANNCYKLTELGNIIKKYDINCLKNDTFSIMHYNICSDAKNSETWYWFFNVLKSNVITKDSLINSLLPSWVESQGKKVSPKSLKRDIECLIQFYTVSENPHDPEDTIFSEFSKLGLVQEIRMPDGNRAIKKTRSSVEKIGINALMYVLLDYCTNNNQYIISVDDILNGYNLWGKIFNFDKQTSMEALNILSLQKENPIIFNRTSNLDTIQCPKIDPLSFLRDRYKKEEEYENSIQIQH